mmetsp:Transcript_19012/g.19137  ORF Transcript_19012/g.19137 Transcript_19012/m.19137 type:complete len:390 (-) Transcript_19012:363-1532(-)
MQNYVMKARSIAFLHSISSVTLAPHRIRSSGIHSFCKLSRFVSNPRSNLVLTSRKPCISSPSVLRMASDKVHKAAMDDVSVKGEFVRKDSAFRDFVTADGSTGFKAEPNRYVLYVSLACPWAHRTLIVRALKKLEDVIDVIVVDHYMDGEGWRFPEDESVVPGATPDKLYGFKRIRELYFKAVEGYSGRFTVPVLWDKQKETIVNNESKEIIVMLNQEFNEFSKNPELDLFPSSKRNEIVEVSEDFYNPVNNGVYRCGFARSQEAYSAAFVELFEKLDELEMRLDKSRFLVGDELTLADIRLFTTLIRFDAVYVLHFKCNKKMLREYPNLYNYTKDVYQTEEIKATVNFDHIKMHYFRSHPTINPLGIVPLGPSLNFDEPHDRTTRSYP